MNLRRLANGDAGLAYSFGRKLMVLSVFVADELKNKTVCEDQELKLHCHESKFLNIYSATYGRRTQERDVCASQAGWLPPFGRCCHPVIIGVQEGNHAVGRYLP